MAEGEEDYECGSFKPTKCARWSMFLIALIIGVILVVSLFFDAIIGKISQPAAISMCVVGNVLVIVSTLLLYGPQKFFTSIKDPDRIIFSIIYLCGVAAGIIGALVQFKENDKFGPRFFRFVFLGANLVTMTLYILTYFPKIRACLKNCCSSIFGACCKKSDARDTPLTG